MAFFKKYEKYFIRALVYGLIAGFYFSILLIAPQEAYPHYDSYVFNYILSILRYSIMGSLIATAATILYLYLYANDQDKSI